MLGPMSDVERVDRAPGGAPGGPDAGGPREGEGLAPAGEALAWALLDGMLDPVIAIDGQGTIQQASRSVRTVFGYDPAELVGTNIKHLMPEPHRSQHDDYLEHYRRTGETNILGRTREFQIVRKDGELREVELSVSRVDPPDGGEPVFIGSFRDMTDKVRSRRRETSMLRALATLGESTAALVHEIKNPITAVNMALRAVADELGEDHKVVLDELVGRMKRLELQLRQSLGYVRPLELRLVPCDAAALFDDVQRFLRPMLSNAGVTVDADVEPGTPPFPADPRCMEEVLSNLVMNALEMSPGGLVRLTAGAVEGGDSVWLRVEDDGPGIPNSVRERLFQPFVTTKEQGTGLGLPICRRILEEHDGSLEAEPDPCELGGAAFRITLPTRGPAAVGAAGDPDPQDPEDRT